MGRNEIKLRKQSMSSGRIAQHRNYGDLLARHDRDTRIRRIARLFMYFLIIAFLVVLYFMVTRIGEKKGPAKKPASAWVLNAIHKASSSHNNRV